jgi:hypothetical protein
MSAGTLQQVLDLQAASGPSEHLLIRTALHSQVTASMWHVQSARDTGARTQRSGVCAGCRDEHRLARLRGDNDE